MSRKLLLLFRKGCIVCLCLLASASAQAQRPLGTDVSGFQPSVNWTTVKNGGVSFAWAKASQGTAYTYPSTFPSQATGARSQGIAFGAYHYATPSVNPNLTGANSADSEAAFFWNQAGADIKNGGGYLVPMLDWEDTGVTASQFTAAKLTAWANEWCNAVVRYGLTYGVVIRPVIYTGTWYSNPVNGYPGLTTSITNWPVWLSSYPSNPNPQTGYPGYPSSLSTYPWPSWNLWQYADTNWSGGDADVYNGTLTSFLQAFQVGGTTPPVLTNPTSLSVTPGASVTFSPNASGQTPLSYQWLFNGSPIRGATTATYTLASVQWTNAGGYAVIVTNATGSVASTNAFLSVFAPLTNAPGAALAPPGLVNWWPADGNASDIFGANNATPYNGLSYTNGMVGLAFHFDGATSYLLVNGGVANPPNWTACLWVNRQTAPGVSAALLGDKTYALKLQQYGATNEVGFSKVSVGDYLFNPGYTVPAGVWTHLAFVGTSTSVALYTNGVFEGSTNVSNFPLPRACVGADLLTGVPGDFMAGALDEIQVYNSALSAAQIKTIYSAGSAGLVRAPLFTGISTSGAGKIQLALQGQTGKTFTLYTSTNLVNWTKLTSLANPIGTLQYQSSSTNPQVYYKVSQP